MLTDDQIDVFGESFTELFQRLEESVIDDIARRVRKTERWTETAELQAKFMRDLGFSPTQIRLEVLGKLNADKAFTAFVDQNTVEAKAAQQKAINEAKEELRELAPEIYKEVGNMSFNADLSMWSEAGKKLTRGGAVDNLIRVMQARGTDDLLNLTKSLGFRYPAANIRAARAYSTAVNDALTKTVSGAFSYQSSIDAAVRQLASSGLRTIDFASGVSRQLDTAARNAVLTSLGQLTGDIMQANIESSGVTKVQVSSHWGARPSHASWQGGIYTMEEFRSVCGYGNPSSSSSIYSCNCRHHHYPYWDGVSEQIACQPEPGPFDVGGRTYTYFQATQKQRAMEHEIRALKREVNAGGDKAELGSRIRSKTMEYQSFSKAINIRPKVERITVFGYDRNTAGDVLQAIREREIVIAAARSAEEAKAAAFEAEKQAKIESVRKLIQSSDTVKTLNIGAQNKHIPGSKGYIDGRSYLYGDLDAAKALVERYHGTGEILFDSKNEWKNKELAIHSEPIGVCINGEDRIETNAFVIHYGKKGTHIVPAWRR